MDPASSIVGIITFGFTVFKKVESLREYIKAAPDQLQALQDSCTAAALLLRRLKQVHERMPYRTMDPSGIEQLHQLWSNVGRYLGDIDAALKKLNNSVKSNEKGRFRRFTIYLRKWYFKPDEVENLAKKLSVLQGSLLMMVNLTNSYFLERMMTRTEELNSCNCSEDAVDGAYTLRDNELPCPCRYQCARHKPIAVTPSPTPPESYSDNLPHSQDSLPLAERHFASDGVHTHAEDMWVPPDVRRPHPPETFSPRIPLHRPLDSRSTSSPCLSRPPCPGVLAIEKIRYTPSLTSPPAYLKLSIPINFALEYTSHAVWDNGSRAWIWSSFTKFTFKLV